MNVIKNTGCFGLGFVQIQSVYFEKSEFKLLLPIRRFFFALKEVLEGTIFINAEACRSNI